MAEDIVQWPYDADPMANNEVSEETRIMAANERDLDKMASVTVGQLAEVAATKVEMSGIEMEPVTGGATSGTATNIPNGPSGQNRKAEASPGWYKFGSAAAVEAQEGFLWTIWWDGSSWSLENRGPLPKGEDGASLLKPWSESSADYPYAQNVQVRHDGVAYVSLVNNNTSEPGTNPANWQAVGGSGGVTEWSAKVFREDDQVIHKGGLYKAAEITTAADEPGVSPKWVLKIAGYREGNSPNIYEIVDPEGNVLAWIDENGKWHASYEKNAIDVEMVNGLKGVLGRLNKLSPLEGEGPNLLEFKDPEGNILGHVDAEGGWHLPKLASDSLTKVKQVNPFGVTGKREVHLPKMEFFRVDMYGPLPTDTTGEIGTEVVLEFTYLRKKIVTFNAECWIQGNISAGFSKSNFSVDILNDDMKSVDVKIGHWPVVDGFHMKGLQRDPTHVRDTGGTRVWREMARTRPFPYNYIRDLLTPEETNKSETEFNVKRFYNDDAQFIGDGIPFELYYHGQFRGLYTWKLKKSRAVYAFDNRNENHIQLDGIQGAGYEVFDTYEDMAAEWEVKSPRSRNVTQATKDNAMRIFQYWEAVKQGEVDLLATHQDYIHLVAWIDYMIWSQLIYHTDNVYNNHHIGTYNGTHWVPFPHDIDAAFGNEGNTSLPFVQTGFVLQADPYYQIRTKMPNEVSERYTELRNSGVLTMDNFRKIFGGISSAIPAWVYEQNNELWTAAFAKPQYHTMDQIYSFLHSRLEFLDSNWLIS